MKLGLVCCPSQPQSSSLEGIQTVRMGAVSWKIALLSIVDAATPLREHMYLAPLLRHSQHGLGLHAFPSLDARTLALNDLLGDQCHVRSTEWLDGS